MVREQLGDMARWSPEMIMLGAAVDLLAAGNWQRAGNRHAKRPKSVLPQQAGRGPQVKRFGSGGRPIAEMAQLLESWAHGPDEGEG